MVQGFTAYTLIIKSEHEENALQLLDKHNSLLTLTGMYKISCKKQDYTIIQIDAIYKSDSSKPLTKFITRNFDFVALHQEMTNYILVEYEEDWEEFCDGVYEIERDIKMVYYHCMTILERYNSFIHANPCLQLCMDLTWERMDRLTRAVYKLDFEKTAEWLFQEEEDLCLVDEATMITYGVEAIDGIKKDEFKVGILNKKTCF